MKYLFVRFCFHLRAYNVYRAIGDSAAVVIRDNVLRDDMDFLESYVLRCTDQYLSMVDQLD